MLGAARRCGGPLACHCVYCASPRGGRALLGAARRCGCPHACHWVCCAHIPTSLNTTANSASTRITTVIEVTTEAVVP